jgi:hypothetical protein
LNLKFELFSHLSAFVLAVDVPLTANVTRDAILLDPDAIRRDRMTDNARPLLCNNAFKSTPPRTVRTGTALYKAVAAVG